MEAIGIGVLVSGGGTNLQAIIDACERTGLKAAILFVGSDNPLAGGVDRARKHHIPTFVVDYAAIIRRYQENPAQVQLPPDADLDEIAAKQAVLSPARGPEAVRSFLATRTVAEAQLLGKMAPYPFDLLVLAGFMRTLTPYFIDRVNFDRARPRIMNIHPALLPAFAGTDGYGDTYRYGCRIGGCTVHFVDYGEDTGPIIDQQAFHIEPGDTLEVVRRKGLELEWALYPKCIQLFAEGRLHLVTKTHTLKGGRSVTRTIVEIRPPRADEPRQPAEG
jgi:phosphoribosylglycinamide formyltransferase-1